ncbi:MAG: radical SAM protein, partial [Bacteroidales bacterium]|nr:radical SAM protein [Bacteroidales bacterium]
MNKNDLKILLINPPQTFYPGSQTFCKSFPIGLGYIAAVVDSLRFRIEILDTMTTDFEASLYDDVRQYGMSFANIEKEIKIKAPNVVCITCPFTTQIENTIKVAEIVKKINSKTIVIVGGPHASVKPEETLNDSKDIDIVVIGEGERTIANIMEILNANEYEKISQINGIAYRKDHKIVCNKKVEFIQCLDELPFPAYHLFDMEKYCDINDVHLYSYSGVKQYRELSMITSRGCPFNCVFCSIHIHMGNKCRENSADYVIDHLKYVIKSYGINYIHFDDDNLTYNKKRFSDILDRIIKENFSIKWDTPNGIRADLSFDLVKKAKKSGCVGLTMAVESGEQKVLNKIINKKLDLKEVINMAKSCKKSNIPLSAFFVLGFPGETKKNMKKTVKFAEMLYKQFSVFPAFMIATPLYGTRLYNICEEKKYFVKDVSPRALSEGTQT